MKKQLMLLTAGIPGASSIPFARDDADRAMKVGKNVKKFKVADYASVSDAIKIEEGWNVFFLGM